LTDVVDSLSGCTLSSFSPVNIEEVTGVIRSLNNSASGYDLVKASFLKNNISFFADFMTDMINKTFVSGSFPQSLKVSSVTPIFKGGDRLDVSNYRPISLTSVFSKVVEICIKRRLVVYLDDNNLISNFQFGFRAKSSTTSAAASVVDLVLKHVEEGHATACLFVDISKAFDCLNYKKLETILMSIGMSDMALRVVLSYLENRRQFVVIDSHRSALLALESGVPQGSVLGPLLFLIYINNIFKLKLNGFPILYADDSVLVYKAASLVQLGEFILADIRTLVNFFGALNMKINFDKTKYMIFKMGPNDSALNEIVFENRVISRVDEYEYLGLIIDSTLNWHLHAKKIRNLVSKYAGVFWRLRKILNVKTMLLVYFSHVQSHLLYMLPVWGAASANITGDILKLQSRILKCIFRKPLRFSTNTLYSEIVPRNILMFPHLIEFETIKFIYKLRCGMVRSNSLLCTNFEITGRVTRGSQSLRRGDFISSRGQMSVFYRGITLYNSVPIEIRQSNFVVFKGKLLDYFRSRIA
jgi:hypothetical protein